MQWIPPSRRRQLQMKRLSTLLIAYILEYLREEADISRHQGSVDSFADASNFDVVFEFLKDWDSWRKATAGKVHVEIVYHGTSIANAFSIIDTILRTPGYSGVSGDSGSNSVKVANGSSFGRGNYVAKSPEVALPYSCGTPFFACLALTSKVVPQEYIATRDGELWPADKGADSFSGSIRMSADWPASDGPVLERLDKTSDIYVLQKSSQVCQRNLRVRPIFFSSDC